MTLQYSMELPNQSIHENTASIFSMLSHLLQNEENFLCKYREKLENTKSKISTNFQQLKEDLKMILDQQ
jgi:hypothetical protein